MKTNIWIERIAIGFTMIIYLVVLALFGLMLIAQDIKKAPVREESK